MLEVDNPCNMYVHGEIRRKVASKLGSNYITSSHPASLSKNGNSQVVLEGFSQSYMNILENRDQ